MKKTLAFALICWGFLSPSILRAEPPANRDEVLRLVPADYTFCLVIQDLKGYVDRWERSGLAKKLAESPLLRGLVADPEFQKVIKMQGSLTKQIGINEKELLEDVLGEQIVFAYRSKVEEGILLARVRKPEALHRLFDQINAWQKKAGELKELEEKDHAGVKYLRRVAGGLTLYYFFDGPFLAMSEKESLIQSVIDQTRARPARAAPSLVQRFSQAKADKALAALWINPRSFDDELKAKAREPGPGAGVVQAIHGVWQALDAIFVTIGGEDEFQLRLSLQARVKDLPAGSRPAFTIPSKTSALWNHFPDSALATVAGRFDFAGAGFALGDLADQGQRLLGDPLELDLFKDLLPNLGPDWGICVLPPEGSHVLPQALAAVAVKPGQKNVDRALYSGLQSAAQVAVLTHNLTNKGRLQLTTIKQDAVEVKVVTGDKVLPPGFSPAFALKDGFLVLATTPSAIQQFRARPAQAPRGGEVPVVRISCVNLAKMLRDKRQPIQSFIAEKNQIPVAFVSEGLNVALAVLDLFDDVAITHQSGGGQLAWTLRIRPAASK